MSNLCKWKFSQEYESYATECGEYFYIIKPSGSGQSKYRKNLEKMRYCQFCGDHKHINDEYNGDYHENRD